MPGLSLTLKRHGFFLTVLSALVLGASVLIAPAKARSLFDGSWSVLIVTDAGDCDRAYRYALQIRNGRVFYNDSAVNISGHVSPSGQVHVNVGLGQTRASGSGRLSADYGNGRWTGSSSTSRCSGHWEAERRG